MAVYSGLIESVTFENVDDSYYVVKCRLDKPSRWEDGTAQSVVVLQGTILGIVVKPGTWIRFEGKAVQHAKYGWQFQIIRAPVGSTVWAPQEICHLLEGVGVQGVLTRVLRRELGDDLQAGLEDVERLSQINGFDVQTAQFLRDKWMGLKGQYQALTFLQELGLHPARLKAIWKTLGDQAPRLIAENPWCLLRVDGIDLRQADSVAVRLGFALDRDERLAGVVLHTCRNARSYGHMFVTLSQVVQDTQRSFPDATQAQITNQLVAFHKNGDIKLDRHGRGYAVYEPWFYDLEAEGARLLQERVAVCRFATPEAERDFCLALGNTGPKTRTVAQEGGTVQETVDAAVAEWQEQTGMRLSANQLLAVVNGLTKPVSVMTGLPGTGKSTSSKAVCQILIQAGMTVLLCAPTGIAAKRLQQVTGHEAKTIHLAFSAKSDGEGEPSRDSNYAGVTDDGDRFLSDGREGKWGYGPGNPHPADFVIIDEVSMLDANLLYRVLSCTKPTASIMLVGDAAQLPSVGPGDVLRSIIKSGKVPTVALTEIYRQALTSYIVEAAHMINAGSVPEVTRPDFLLSQADREETILSNLLKVASTLSSQGTDFQVMSPKHTGTLGVTNLNQELRKIINPPETFKQEYAMGSESLREGDRVMVVKNNYRIGIVNGDIGKVLRIDRANKVVVTQFGADQVEIPLGDVKDFLRMAYATTIHKCVSPDTWVTTDLGLQQIGSIAPSGNVLTDRGMKPYCNWKQNPETLCYVIETDSGHTLTMTSGHEMVVWSPDQDRTVPARDLEVGDLLLSVQGWVPVTAIRRDVSATVCIEVPDGHRFVQNDLVGSNCQGQEMDIVLLPLHMSFRHQLQRNLLYTAVTRAKKRVFLFGQHAAFTAAIQNSTVDQRNTLLADRISPEV